VLSSVSQHGFKFKKQVGEGVQLAVAKNPVVRVERNKKERATTNQSRMYQKDKRNSREINEEEEETDAP
jgi:hypothetical protein